MPTSRAITTTRPATVTSMRFLLPVIFLKSFTGDSDSAEWLENAVLPDAECERIDQEQKTAAAKYMI
jgi:hypothetical protein